VIAIIDYGMGNLRSVEKALLLLGAECLVMADADEVRRADQAILPGVGAFGPAMERLRQAGLVGALQEFIDEGKPFLGICLGMQLLFAIGRERGDFPGLGLVPGEVVRFPEGLPVRVPHIGWNELTFCGASPLWRGLQGGERAYFVHSYFGVLRDEGWLAATTTHGIEFAAAIWRGNVFATQFHPEKSGAVGMTMLRNFVEL